MMLSAKRLTLTVSTLLATILLVSAVEAQEKATKKRAQRPKSARGGDLGFWRLDRRAQKVTGLPGRRDGAIFEWQATGLRLVQRQEVVRCLVQP